MQSDIIVAIIGFIGTVVVGWWQYHRGTKHCDHGDLCRHPLFGRLKYLREIVVPRFPGYFSAFGMLVTEPRRDLVRTEPMAAERTGMATVRLRRARSSWRG